jgi:small subunit ribosomal protein S16
MSRNPETQTVVDVSRVRYWLSVGAQPSEKVQVLLNKLQVKKPAPGEPWQVAPAPAAPSPETPQPATT